MLRLSQQVTAGRSERRLETVSASQLPSLRPSIHPFGPPSCTGPSRHLIPPTDSQTRPPKARIALQRDGSRTPPHPPATHTHARAPLFKGQHTGSLEMIKGMSTVIGLQSTDVSARDFREVTLGCRFVVIERPAPLPSVACRNTIHHGPRDLFVVIPRNSSIRSLDI